MSDHIPFAIQADIMKRLPTKSLMQFRSVSKTWKALIDSSTFITDYNIRQTKQDHLLVCPMYITVDEPKIVSVVDDNTFPQHKVTLTSAMQEERLPLMVLGVSHGLFCLSPDIYLCLDSYMYPRKTYSVVLWNPCIRKSVSVVVTSDDHSVIGFGVRPDTSDPMLVKVNYYPWEVEVYSLSSGAWRSKPTINHPSNAIVMRSDQDHQVAIDEFIYFLAFERITFTASLHLIMSFDMTSEEMTQISLPRSLALASDCNMRISKLNGSLVVLETTEEATGRGFGVWMMERGVSIAFTKLYTINAPHASVLTLLGFRKNNEPIFYAVSNFEVIDIFVHEHDNIKSVRINGKAFPYTETLLLLDH